MVLGSHEGVIEKPARPAGDGNHDVLNRGFGFRAALSIAFADISPIVALYAIFALGLFAAGPRFFWAFPIVLCGQLLVALVFGELASRFPYAGSVYQWARHAKGTTWGWTAAWAYIWGLTLTLSTMSYAAAGIIGIPSPTVFGRPLAGPAPFAAVALVWLDRKSVV